MTVRIRLNLSREDFEYANQVAEAHGKSLSQWVSDLARGAVSLERAMADYAERTTFPPLLAPGLPTDED